MIKNSMDERIEISDGAMYLIEDIIQKQHLENRYDILNAICEQLEERFTGSKLEYHLKQMHLSTTKEILRAIDIYFIMRENFPGCTLRKPEKMYGKKTKDQEQVS